MVDVVVTVVDGVFVSVKVTVDVVVEVTGTPTVSSKSRCHAYGEPSPLLPMTNTDHVPELISFLAMGQVDITLVQSGVVATPEHST